MKAYNKGITKVQFVNEIKKHQQVDNFIKGSYGDYGDKGCAVGCSIQSIMDLTNTICNRADHTCYEQYLGIPEWLARLEDSIFENVRYERSKVWPLEFSSAINQESNLDNIRTPFIVYILKQNIITQKKQLKLEIDDDIKKVIDVNKQMITAQESGAVILIAAARSAARSASFEKYANKLLNLIRNCKE